MPEAHSMSLGLAEKWNGHIPCRQAGQEDRQLEGVVKSISPALNAWLSPTTRSVYPVYTREITPTARQATMMI